MCEMLPRGLRLVALPLNRLNGQIQRTVQRIDPVSGSLGAVASRRLEGAPPQAGSSHKGEPKEEQGLTDAREGGWGEKEGDSDGR